MRMESAASSVIVAGATETQSRGVATMRRPVIPGRGLDRQAALLCAEVVGQVGLTPRIHPDIAGDIGRDDEFRKSALPSARFSSSCRFTGFRSFHQRG